MVFWQAFCLCLFAWATTASAQDVIAAAVVRSENHTVLASERSGVLARLDAKMGDRLAQGDLIAEFSCAEQNAKQAAAQARADQSKIELETQKLLLSKGAAGENAVALAQSVYDQHMALFQAEQAQTSTCAIYAPFDSDVVSVSAQPFGYLKVGEPVIELTDPKNLFIDIIVPADYLARIQIGARATYVYDADTTSDHEIVVKRIGSAIDPVSQTSNIHGAFVNGTRALRPGQSGRVIFRE